jgi:anti-sigma B factor antagonist
MNYNIKEQYNCVIFEFKGKLMGGPDTTKFNDKLKEYIKEDKLNVIADLGNVSFMNSSGLGALIGGLTTMRNAGGDLRLSRVGDRIESLLIVTKLITVFNNYKTLEEAVESYQDEKKSG